MKLKEVTYQNWLDETVDKIIKNLNNRAGFDNWWDGIDKDIQQEIKDEIALIIQE